MLRVLAHFLLLFIASSIAAPPQDGHASCWRPRRRVDWNTLKKHDKVAYFAAETCLLTKPSRHHFEGAVTRYDDLIYPHQQQGDILGGTDTWHRTGQFLAIHRFYILAHETLLRKECGYTGPIPYWDELSDAGNFNASRVILDFAFFDNIPVNIGPGKTHTPHILSRRLNETYSALAGQEKYDAVMAKSGFGEFQRLIFVTLHVGGHGGVGGDMLDFMTSPADPLFWMHHTYLDMLWYKWQGKNNSRINDFENIGYETLFEPLTGYTNTTKDTLLSVYGIIPDASVGDVLKTEGGYLCYIYDI